MHGCLCRDKQGLNWGRDTVDLLQLAKRIGPQCEAAEHKGLPREKSLALDRVVSD